MATAYVRQNGQNVKEWDVSDTNNVRRLMHLEKDAYLIVSSLNKHGLTLPRKMVYVYCKYSGNDFKLIKK